MNEAAYREWWTLHLRVAKGEILSREEQTSYETGRQTLREEERIETSLIQLRHTREEIQNLEAERERLHAQQQHLRERVMALEAALSESAKQALGVGD